ncbi:MAG: aminopeptidase P family protein [Prevotella sp.]|nr:aminopeptidase P family protein [Prevotella sp.]
MKTINEKLSALREVMREEHLAAFIFPSTDPHQGEYIPAHWESRKWISGFDGSAGTAVVTMTNAALWTDSRYFIAAEEQLRDTEFVLMKERIEGTPTIAAWLSTTLQDESTSTEVGIDGMCCSASMVEEIKDELRKDGGFTVRTNIDPMQRIWIDRPSVPQNPIEIHPLEYAGETATDKLARIRQALRKKHIDGMLVSALDDIAWTLNLRGTDVHCNPVFVSYLLIASDKTTLFVDEAKLTDAVKTYLKEIGVKTDGYHKVAQGLRDYFEYNILLDPDETSYTLMQTVDKKRVIREKTPIPSMKAVKNEAEIKGFRNAMLRDGIAMTKFLYWLKQTIGQEPITELTVSDKLYQLRSEQSLFRDISFDTIAAYQEHGAIVHYEPTTDSDVELKPEGLLLVDSGAQYQDGTTDITRTIALGPVTEEQKRVYTLVLKGHIQLELLKFPAGASGTQLDALARKDMWAAGMNFLHGTGHGVGSYLNVHEGPHQIRMEYRPEPLRAGMTITDEPGIYLEGRFGVRIENILLITPYMKTEFGEFLQFESLTLCPIDTTPIIVEMLTKEERQWLNDYHRRVYDVLSPYLNNEEKVWLANATKPI